MENLPKKGSSCAKFLAFLGCLFLIIVSGCFVVSFLVFHALKDVGGQKDLGVTYTIEDYNNFVTKTGIEFGKAPEELCLICEIPSVEGQVEKEVTLNNAEVSAWFQNQNSKYLSNTQIKISKDQVEISTLVTYDGNSYPVYAAGTINTETTTTLNIDIKTLEAGSVPIPVEQIITEAEKALETMANSRIIAVPGFSINSLEFGDGFLKFNGTLPQKIY